MSLYFPYLYNLCLAYFNGSHDIDFDYRDIRPKGTRDILPPESFKKFWVESKKEYQRLAHKMKTKMKRIGGNER